MATILMFAISVVKGFLISLGCWAMIELLDQAVLDGELTDRFTRAIKQ